MSQQEDEQRRFFRLNDSLKVSYRKLRKDDFKANENPSRGDVLGLGVNFDNRVQELLDTCKAQLPEIAELLDMVNQKLTRVVDLLDIDDDDDDAQHVTYKLRQVNISACGMAFQIEERLDVGQMLSLDLILGPDKDSEEQVSTPATVVTCDDLPQAEHGNQFYIRLNFVHFKPEAQQRLIQYLTKRQVQLHKYK